MRQCRNEEICHPIQELEGDNSGADKDDPDSKVRQSSNASEIMKWMSPTRFLVSEESQFQIRTRDPSSAVGKYGEVEKENKDNADSPGGVYHVWFEGEGECELLPGDKSQVLSTHPVKKESDK